MARAKEPEFHCSEECKEAAYAVIDKHLAPYAPPMYRDYLKRMINDQIIAMKVPGFIGHTVASYIYCELDCHSYNINVPDHVLVALKQDLIDALEGVKKDGV